VWSSITACLSPVLKYLYIHTHTVTDTDTDTGTDTDTDTDTGTGTGTGTDKLLGRVWSSQPCYLRQISAG
jgi:hypothetical protein